MKNKSIILIVGLLIFYFLLGDKVALYYDAVNVINTEINSPTLIAPVLETKIDPDKNLVYCSTAQMAWNCLHNNIIKETIEIQNQPWYVEKLNQYVNLPHQISQDAYVANAGFGNDVIEKIKEELINKFQHVPSIINFPELKKDELFAFSYLIKILDFKEKYGTFFTLMNFNNKEIKVKAFGFKDLKQNNDNTELKKQIKLLYYYKNGFILELLTKSSKDTIILSTIKPDDTLLDTFNKINFLIDDPKNPLRNKKDYKDIETLIIPKINFVIQHEFKELIGKYFKNSKFNQHFISKAFQYINFNLNEKGARLESYFMFYTQTGNSFKLIINGPFTIFIKDKSSTYPYFMAYIGNDDLLEK